ncbi:MAG: hypothetical protein ACKO3A_02640, partial [Opitutia bacterium]
VAAAEAAERTRLRALGVARGAAEGELDSFVDYCLRTRQHWWRASELESPADRGHFLRTSGQSDRDFVENANRSASIPQALLFLNGEAGGRRGLADPCSPLSLVVRAAPTPAAKVDAIFLSVLGRRATTAEQSTCAAVVARGDGFVEEIAYALLNSRQFIFEQ